MEHRYSYHPLPTSYLHIISQTTSLKLVIAGKDPFPTSPTGIPFCKATWEEQLNDNNSGLHVLKSLGIDLENARMHCAAPSGVFHRLAKMGIAFINASYHFLDTTGLPRKDHVYVDKALIINKPIIMKAENVLLCGEAKILEEKIPGVDVFLRVVHPDTRNRGFRLAEWQEWWQENAIKEFFDLDVNDLNLLNV